MLDYNLSAHIIIWCRYYREL